MMSQLRPDLSALRCLCNDCHCDTLGSDTVVLDDFESDGNDMECN